MERLLVRFLTRSPFRPEPWPAAALILYDLPPPDLIQRVLRLRERVRLGHRGLRSPRGYLLNDGSVLAVELLRELGDRPLGYSSFAGFRQDADHTLDIVTDLASPALRWEFSYDGVPVDDRLRPSFSLSNQAPAAEEPSGRKI